MDHNQLTIKTFMAIMVERDAAIQERNLALEERKRSFAERDLAMLQRDAALVERNSAIQERDEAVSTLRFRGNFMSESENIPTSRESKHGFNGEEIHHMFEIETDTYQAPPENTKPTKVFKRAKSPRGGRKRADDSTQIKLEKEECSDDAQQIEAWKDELGLNQVNFDESAMPVPVCSCTGEPQPCYRWGNGGWQSACCTTIMSMYPLPQVTNKRYSRVSGRKMSGGAFTKLLTRLASQGYDLSTTLDMKDHWSKHGTNRYTTVK